jgi:hypothetical protein
MGSSAIEKCAVSATDVEVNDDNLTVELSDGRTIAAPPEWFPRLVHASAEERIKWRLIARGREVHWPSVDEDVSVAGLLAGQPSMESQSSFKKWLSARTKPNRAPKKSGKRN